MKNLIACTLTLIFFIVFFAVGSYYSLQHPKQRHLKSCFGQGGKCLEEYNCEDQYKNDYLTLCVIKRKICCMPQISIKSGILDYE
ncbi:uncharacterized protein LOC111070117 [Drosophila obscura]|uniref:uncharacterized protein LOC111070117 n=1 Tax=Drosophila obscura TaxID=7282 RepID=UPI000BA02E49|nr:uncharacterized protein LOC111070117 [Drosophila obscura]